MVDWKFIVIKYWKKARWRKKEPPPEPEVWKVLSKIHGDIFVDVGANGGQVYSIPLHSHFKHVFAFEPNLKLASLMEQRIKKRRIENITILRFAVSDKDGEEALWIDGSQSSGSSTLMPDRALQRSMDGGKVTVQTVALDSYLHFNNIDLLKIDAEGAEFMVLRGAEKTLSKTRNILVEAHHSPYTLNPRISENLESRLSETGFKCSWVDATHIFGQR